MGRVHPKTVITDKEAAIGAAVAEVFPNTRRPHRIAPVCPPCPALCRSPHARNQQGRFVQRQLQFQALGRGRGRRQQLAEKRSMAEAVVSSVLNKLGSLMTPQGGVGDRGSHLRKLDTEIRKIRSKLEGISRFLRDAETKADEDEALKLWIRRLSKTCYDVEDILDDTQFLQSRLDLAHQRGHRHGLSGFLKERLRFRHDLALSQRLAIQMAEIRARLDEISDPAGYDFNQQMAEDVPIMFRRSAAAEGGDDDGRDDVVGAEKAKGYLIDWLLDKESRLTAVSVVGMGGSGKTTLAKLVYNSQHVRNHFDYRAWITVAQDFKIQTVLRLLLEQLAPEEDKSSSLSSPPSMRGLGKALAACLEKQRFLIVLDDVWSIDVWEGLRNALPDRRTGSRVLITTRVRDVALSTYGRVYELQFLTAKESWRLFCRKAFPPTGACPPELEAISRQIVKRCGGLPLAITVVGTLLSSKKTGIAAWKAFEKSFSSQMEANQYFKMQNKALKLSYHDLPYYIRSCFLYLTLFPDDAPIRFSKLARLWAAEGLLQTTTSSEYSEEEAAEDCLSALVHRGFVQVSESYDGGRVRSCQVHDFVRDMIRSIAKELDFAAAAASSRAAGDVRSFQDVRRISISNKNNLDDVSQDLDLSHFGHLRSLLISGPFRSLERSLHLAMSSLRVLRVLDLEGTNLKSFPTGIENLVCLRYLSFRNTDITALPKSLGKLSKLETLDLKGTQLSSLPVQIAKLEALRHLIVGGSRGKKGVLIAPGMGSLTALRTLKYIDIAHQQTLVNELGKLTQMRSLCLTNLKKGDGSILSSVQQMPHLVSFKAISEGDREILDMDALSSPPSSLQRLLLKGCMELGKLPTWIASGDSLVKIHLEGSGLLEDPFGVLESLPRLAVLNLVEAYDGQQLCCDDSQGFPELKVLNLVRLHELQSLQVKKGAMRYLHKLQFDSCNKLWALPADVKHLSQLQQLHLINATSELVENIESYKQKEDTIVGKIIIKPANRSHSHNHNISGNLVLHCRFCCLRLG
ncbi:hypothetical protein ACLOJK_015413 [Asimina triloba]